MTYPQRISRRRAPQSAPIPRANQARGNARLMTAGMVASSFAIAVPNDPLQLAVDGFDTTTPQLTADLATGAL
jgi:hypothetical protein